MPKYFSGRSSTLEELKKEYRKLVLKHHPDISQKSSAAFLLIQEEYQLLQEQMKEGTHETDEIDFDEILRQQTEYQTYAKYNTEDRTKISWALHSLDYPMKYEIVDSNTIFVTSWAITLEEMLVVEATIKASTSSPDVFLFLNGEPWVTTGAITKWMPYGTRMPDSGSWKVIAQSPTRTLNANGDFQILRDIENNHSYIAKGFDLDRFV